MKTIFKMGLSLSLLAIVACQGQVNTPSPGVEKGAAPVAVDVKKELPGRSLSGFKDFSITPATEVCGDWKDNNSDKFIDEGCYACPSNGVVADFNADGVVDKSDAAVVLLVQNNKTKLSGSEVSCIDVDGSGLVDTDDVVKVLDISEGLASN